MLENQEGAGATADAGIPSPQQQQTQEQPPAGDAGSQQASQQDTSGASGAEKRIRQLVAQRKQVESERDEYRAELEQLKAERLTSDKPPTDQTVAQEKGLTDRLAKLERQIAQIGVDRAINEQIDDFRSQHSNISDVEEGIILSIVESHGLRDEKTNEMDFNTALAIYQQQKKKILEESGYVKADAQQSASPKTSTAIPGSPRSAGGVATKSPLQMTEPELLAEWQKRVPNA